MQDKIQSFRGSYEFLSNFYNCPVTWEGITYQNSEAAFQASKIYIPNNIEATNNLRINWGFNVATPSEAKKLGRKRDIGLRPDWEQVKDEIMYNILKVKFTQNPELGLKLVRTNPLMLEEGNTWHDNYWGNCKCEKCRNKGGKNQLGKSLMQLRTELMAMFN